MPALRGKPGVCCLITGPGLMNAATPIGEAYSDSVPVLVLCSVNAKPDLGKGRGRLHEISDQHAAIAPLTAFTRTVMTTRRWRRRSPMLSPFSNPSARGRWC